MSIFSKRIIENNLLKEDRNELIKKITDALKRHPDVLSSYLFGSFATATHHNNSDIDLLIVSKTKKPFTQRNIDFIFLLEIYAPMDILVYTEDEFQNILNNHDHGFWKIFRNNHLKIV